MHLYIPPYKKGCLLSCVFSPVNSVVQFCRSIPQGEALKLLFMAERTGTLWENDGAYASYCHGFASYIVHVFYRNLLRSGSEFRTCIVSIIVTDADI